MAKRAFWSFRLLNGLTLLILGGSGTACQRPGESASSLYNFPDTMPVAVQVKVDYKINDASGPTINYDSQPFVLNAFLLSNSESQVALAHQGQPAQMDLPVTLSGPYLEFDTTVMVPRSIRSDDTGYTLRFALVAKNTGLGITSNKETVANLDTLKSGIQPGAAAATNPVPMSIATTLAYAITKDTVGVPVAPTSAYEELLTLITAQISSTEENLDSATTTDLQTFASAIYAGVKLLLTTDLEVQSQVADALQSITTIERTNSEGNDVAQNLIKVLKNFTSDTKVLLGNNDTVVAQMFKDEAISATDIPDPTSYTSVVYVPSAVSCSDTDITDAFGGTVVITPPKMTRVIDSYHVYLGGNSVLDGRKQLLGSVSKDSIPLALPLPKETVPGIGITRLWVFPLIAGRELDMAASCLINNISKPAGLSYKYPTSTYFTGQVIEANTASSTGGGISTFSIKPNLPAGLTLDAKTGRITGTPSETQATTIHTVTATNGHDTTTTAISVTVKEAPPSGLSYAHPAPIYIAGSSIVSNIPTSTGGNIVTYSISPTLPAGLNLNTSTGSITGRPTASHATTIYTVTGTNPTASTTTTIAITINPAPPATVTLNPPATIISGNAFNLGGSCSGELGTISVDIGNDHIPSAGVSIDPVVCSCEGGSFNCPSVSINYAAFGTDTVSYKTSITSAWAGNASHVSNNSTTIVHLDLSGVASIADNGTFSPTGTCSPNGAVVTLTAPTGFSPVTQTCSCTSNSLNTCAAFTEITSLVNTALSLNGSVTYSSMTMPASQNLTVINQAPDVLSGASGLGYAYQSEQLGGLSFTRYGHNSPAGNLVSHQELTDFIDDPEGHADGLRDDNSIAQRPYHPSHNETGTPGWTVSATNAKYANAVNEITPVTGTDSFGDTYRGYFVPPEDGIYKFVVLSVDNSVRLMMSPNECPKGAIAVVSADWAANLGAVHPSSKWIQGNGGAYNGGYRYEHNTAVFFPNGTADDDYQHGTTYLLANKIYYLEIRYGEGGGSNAFSFQMDRRNIGSMVWQGAANLKANTMLPYEGPSRYVPREACGGSSYDATLLFSDPESDALTYAAFLVASDGSTLYGSDAEVSSIGLTFNTSTGILSGTVNGSYNGQKVVFTATDASGSNTTVVSSPAVIVP